jgi:hypothetical protein
MLPRFLTSALGQELARLHVSSLLSRAEGLDAFKCSAELHPLQQDALDFWVAAHAFALAEPGVRAVRAPLRSPSVTPFLACVRALYLLSDSPWQLHTQGCPPPDPMHVRANSCRAWGEMCFNSFRGSCHCLRFPSRRLAASRAQ